MKKLLLGACMLLAASWGYADTTDTGDTQVTGQVGVGTYIPQATLEVRMSSSTSFALKVSSADSGALFAVTNDGKAGIGIDKPQAHLDVGGTGDTTNIGLQLRVGNSTSTLLSQQLIFASTGGFYQHAIVSQHVQAEGKNNSIHFLLWDSTGQPNAPASLDAMFVGTVFTSSISVHIAPYGTSDVQLEVSNGLSTGGGTIHRASAGAHSSRSLKTDIVYLDDAQRRQAFDDIKGLKHATFQYKRLIARKAPPKPRKGKSLPPPEPAEEAVGPVHRGLIYEDSPPSIQGPEKTLVLDNRVLNLEMALQEAGKKIAALESKIAGLEKRKKSR